MLVSLFLDTFGNENTRIASSAVAPRWRIPTVRLTVSRPRHGLARAENANVSDGALIVPKR